MDRGGRDVLVLDRGGRDFPLAVIGRPKRNSQPTQQQAKEFYRLLLDVFIEPPAGCRP